MSRPSTMASMLSGSAAMGIESSVVCADGDTGLFDGASVACGDLSCRWRLLTAAVGVAVSDSSSDESESVADCTDWLGEAYRQY